MQFHRMLLVCSLALSLGCSTDNATKPDRGGQEAGAIDRSIAGDGQIARQDSSPHDSAAGNEGSAAKDEGAPKADKGSTPHDQGTTPSDKGSGAQPALPANARVVFLHHSTGEVIWNGGIEPALNALNSQHNKSYQITSLVFPKDSPYGWANYPYDYWTIWVENAGNTPYMEEPTLEMLTKEYKVIVWKHCFPVSNVGADSGAGNVSSADKTIANYKLQYAALKAKMREYPQTRFVLWTGAALVEYETNADEGQRAKSFFEWVKGTWDEKGDNIYIWDFRELETEGGVYLLPKNAAGVADSHPNETFAAQVAPLFAKRLVDVIEGQGDLTSLTGK